MNPPHPEPPAGPFPAPSTKFELRASLSNEGRSVATSVEMDYKIMLLGVNDDARLLGTEVDNSCKRASLWQAGIGGPLSGRMIRPLEPLSFGIEGAFTDETIRTHFASEAYWLFAPVLVGCVVYTIPYSTRTHHTPFVFDIIRTQEVSTDPLDRLFTLGVAVPREKIVLRQNAAALAHHPPD